jgi:hypothetical protein
MIYEVIVVIVLRLAARDAAMKAVRDHFDAKW